MAQQSWEEGEIGGKSREEEKKKCKRLARREKLAQKVGRREKLAQKIGRREIYPLFHPPPPPSNPRMQPNTDAGIKSPELESHHNVLRLFTCCKLANLP